MGSRNVFIDCIRGVNLISMILFHAIWDLVYIYGVEMEWYGSWIGDVWQVCIACTFVILAGYCYDYSHNKFKHGLKVFLAGGVITLVTYVFMPENIIIFGVLTMLGSCMLFMIPLDKFLNKVNAKVGGIVSLILFVMTYNVQKGYLGYEGLVCVQLPKWLYRNLFTTYMGFSMDEFFSTDYFGIIPWMFLFIMGYFLKKFIGGLKVSSIVSDVMEQLHEGGIKVVGRGPITWMGRHSLLVYMLHQPIVYGVLAIIFNL